MASPGQPAARPRLATASHSLALHSHAAHLAGLAVFPRAATGVPVDWEGRGR